MKKVRKLRFLGILGVVIAVLFLIGMSLTQAQVQIQGKPVKPPPTPEATWAVELPIEEDGTMLYGDGTTYSNNDSDVRIKVEKGQSMVFVDRKRRIVFYYYFSFKLVNPTDRYAGFQGVDLDYVSTPDVGLSGIFPGDCESIDSTKCMENFLNQDQPHSEYEYFNLKFQVDEFSFEDSLVFSEGIEDMPLDTPVKFTSHSDWIKVRVQNEEDFLDPYHNVDCDERNYDDGVYNNMNIWFVRLEENRWRIYVGYNPYSGYSPGADLLLQEQYTDRVLGKNKKFTMVTVVPLEATGNFIFYIDFIKITSQ